MFTTIGATCSTRSAKSGKPRTTKGAAVVAAGADATAALLGVADTAAGAAQLCAVTPSIMAAANKGWRILNDGMYFITINSSSRFYQVGHRVNGDGI
jgi:hypothetical protein